MFSSPVRRMIRPVRGLAAPCLLVCIVTVLASIASAQEGEAKKEEKPDLAKRALDVLFESNAEKDANDEKPAETKPADTKSTDGEPKPAPTKPTEGGGTSVPPQPAPGTGTPGTPGAPWPNKPATGTGSGTDDGSTKPKPFVPPGTGTGATTPPVKPIPSAPGTGGEGGGTSVPPRPTPTPAPAPVTAKTYKIQPGDTFSSIAIALYGDEKKWAAIAQANPLVDPTKLKVGQEIRLPDLAKAAEDREKVLAEAAAAVAKPAASGADGVATTVTVQPGDTLSHIAHRVYGKAKYWTVIYEANKDQLKDAGDVKVGQKLKIPPKPTE